MVSIELDKPTNTETAVTHHPLAIMFYIIVLLAATVLRFVGLDAIPLSPAEAQEALSVWQQLQPAQEALTISSPAYFTLTSLLMGFVGASDITARLIPALFGIGLIMLPWLLRKRLGVYGTVTAALFLAVSPTLTAVSRTAGGDAIAIFAILLIAVAILRFLDQKSQRWLYTAAVGLGIGLASAPLFYSGLLTLVLAWTLQRLIGPSLTENMPQITHQMWRRCAIFSLATFFALSTRFITYPAGLGDSAAILGDWLTQFGLPDDLANLLDPFLALARYEVLLLPLGIFAIVWAIWTVKPLGSFLVYWLTFGLLIILTQPGILDNTLLLTLSGYLLLGLFTNFLLRWQPNWMTWAITAGLSILGITIFVNGARFLRVSIYPDSNSSNLWMGVIAFLVAALVIYLVWMWSETAVLQGTWFAVMIVLLIFQWGTNWQLNHVAANDPRERWVSQATDDELPHLVRTMRDISRQAARSDRDLAIASAVNTPVLHWYLRDYPRLQLGETLPTISNTGVLITPTSMSQPTLGSDYVGTDFGLLRQETEQITLSPTPILDTLRWWVFHESTVPLTEDRVILWVRADLVQNLNE